MPDDSLEQKLYQESTVTKAYNPNPYRKGKTGLIVWEPVLIKAAEIVRSYSSGVTLRQLFYRLVSTSTGHGGGILPNTVSAYRALSAFSAEARRGEFKGYTGWFPSLIDPGSEIREPGFDTSVVAARRYAAESYRRDRTTDQAQTIYIVVEKRGLSEQLWDWFSDYGLPVIALGGYASQSLCDTVRSDALSQGRPALMVYGGDLDGTGVDIDRDFAERAGFYNYDADTDRVALNYEQVAEYGLEQNTGKSGDSRSPAFVALYGSNFQVEIDALDPDDLRKLYAERIFGIGWDPDYPRDGDGGIWDWDAYDAIMVTEATERDAMLGSSLIGEGRRPYELTATDVERLRAEADEEDDAR
jgi:hypothetical protein